MEEKLQGKDISISYAITVKDEVYELNQLFSVLSKHIRKNDELVILIDSEEQSKKHDSLIAMIDYFRENVLANTSIHYHGLNKNFGEHKNFLNKLCTKDYIFQIDADEYPHENLLIQLQHILALNHGEIELYFVPRINTVESITEEHINKWGWQLSKEGWVNWPDFQGRIYLNSPVVEWKGAVHEKIVGASVYTMLPVNHPAGKELYCLYHPKTIEKQENQNKFYETI